MSLSVGQTIAGKDKSEWKEIRDFKNYEIHEDLGIRSRISGKSLKGRNWMGYPKVTLMKDGKKHERRIHKLVGEHFIDNPLNLPIVNHIDSDRSNHKKSNLEWVDNSGNQKHRWATQKAGLKKIKYKAEYSSPLTKTASPASEILRNGLRSVRKNKGRAFGNDSHSSSEFKIVSQRRKEGKKLPFNSRKDRPPVIVSKNPEKEMFEAKAKITGREIQEKGETGFKGFMSKLKGAGQIAKTGFWSTAMSKSNKKAVRGIAGMHESAERAASGKTAMSLAGQRSGHVNVSGVVGRAEHNNFRKPEFQKELKTAKNYYKGIRNEEAEALRNFTPTNSKNMKIEYGDPKSPRINKSLALRMQAKELGLPINGGTKDIKKHLKMQKKQYDGALAANYSSPFTV